MICSPARGKQTERENGNYDAIFAGESTSGELMISSVQGDRDPGYGSTSKMLAEAAMCLLHNPDSPQAVWTPASAMGDALIERLQAHAGLSFQIEKADHIVRQLSTGYPASDDARHARTASQ